MTVFCLALLHGPSKAPRPIISKKETKHTTPHTTAQSMYEIRSAGVKGLGIFAKSFIPRGTRIFSEQPLLAIRQDQDARHICAAFRLLSVEDRRSLMSLSHHATKESSIIRWSQALNIGKIGKSRWWRNCVSWFEVEGSRDGPLHIQEQFVQSGSRVGLSTRLVSANLPDQSFLCPECTR
jgi:hypothetical protein